MKMPITSPGASMLNPGQFRIDLLQQRRHEEEREIAEDDRGDGLEQLQKRLDGLAHDVRRKLAQVNRHDGAHRNGDGERHERHGQRPGDQRQNAIVGVREQRSPLGIGQKIPNRYVLKETDRLVEQDADDRHRGGNCRQPCKQQDELDHSFLGVPEELPFETRRDN